MVRALVTSLVVLAAAEDGSLMQFEKASDYGDVHGGSKTSRMQASTEAMENQWKGLLEKIVKSGSLNDPATGNPWMPSKSLILDPVEKAVGEMEEELKEEKGLNSNIMKSHADAVRACIASRDTALDGEVKGLKNHMQAVRVNHATCRTSEDSAINTMETNCGHFEGLQKCGFEQDWFAQYSETGTGGLADVVDAAVTCKGNIATTSDKAAECDGIQSAFAGAACNFGNKLRETCAAYDTCYSKQTGNWDQASASIQKLEAEQKIIYRMLGRIRCFLNVLYDKVNNGEVPTQADIDACVGATVTDEPLDVSYDEKATTKYDCAGAPHPAVADETAYFAAGYGPGDSNWYSAELGTMTEHGKLNPESGAGADIC